LARFDAILVPGGGVREGGQLPSWAKARFDRVVELWDGEWIVALSAGTVHKPPPRDEAGFPVLECVAGARYLARHGIPADRILLEASSYDTIGNAYFARILHCGPRAWRRLLIVNSDFHMPRTEAIFRFVFALDGAGYELEFDSVSDEDVPEERRAKEAEALKGWHATMTRIGTMWQLYEFLYAEHAAYATAPILKERPALSADVLTSY
jgi:hypothetical protein